MDVCILLGSKLKQNYTPNMRDSEQYLLQLIVSMTPSLLVLFIIFIYLFIVFLNCSFLSDKNEVVARGAINATLPATDKIIQIAVRGATTFCLTGGIYNYFFLNI